jgi:hypothetical protein
MRTPILAAAAIMSGVTNVYTNDTVGTGSGTPGPALPPRGGRPHMRAAVLILAGAVIAGGGFAVAEAVSGPGHGGTAGTSAASASGPTGQAALLSGVLTDATSASPTAMGTVTQSGPVAPQAELRRIHRALLRLRLLGGMYGQFAFETKKGPRTLAFERGTVAAVAGPDVTVRAKDGTTWTWVLTSTSVVREDGTRVSASALAVGQPVFAAGPVSGTTRDARLIVIRAAAKHPA